MNGEKPEKKNQATDKIIQSAQIALRLNNKFKMVSQKAINNNMFLAIE